MRDWLVTLEYKEIDTGISRRKFSEVVTADADHFAVTLARNIAHEKYRVGNPVDGIFCLVDVFAMPDLGEVVAVAHVDACGDAVDFDPPAHLACVDFYDGGKDAREGFWAEHPDYEVLLFVAPRSENAWPSDPKGFWRD